MLKSDLKAKLVILFIVIVLLLAISISVAFFLIPVKIEQNQSLNGQTANMSLIFTDDSGSINENLEFGQSIEKKFKIENSGSLDAVAKINWINFKNTYLEGSLTYSLFYKENLDSPYVELISDRNVPMSEEKKTSELANGLFVPAGESYFYKLTITLRNTDFDQTGDLKATLVTEFNIEEGELILLDTILKKANDEVITEYTDGDTKEMFAFNHEATEQTEAFLDYRYIGSEPNNYCIFNQEIWRIIGVFTTEDESGNKEQRVKLVRNDGFPSIKWSGLKEGSTFTNIWIGGEAHLLFNSGDYYNRTGDYIMSGLLPSSISAISKVKWYLGATSKNINLSGEYFYSSERGTTTYQNSRDIFVFQEVGLMYASDYVYTYANNVNEECFTNSNTCESNNPSTGWFYKGGDVILLTQSPRSTASGINSITASGSIQVMSAWNRLTSYTMFPSVYLKSNIEFINGDGSIHSPYMIK